MGFRRAEGEGEHAGGADERQDQGCDEDQLLMLAGKMRERLPGTAWRGRGAAVSW